MTRNAGSETLRNLTVNDPPSPTLEDAIALAAEAHRGQRDKAGAPYILHPLRVMLRLHSEQERIVGVLHDVVEDTGYSLADLRARGYSDSIMDVLDRVTKREGEDYDAFIARAAGDLVAARVKLADLEDNLDLRRLREATPKDVERLDRYVKARHRLRESVQ